MHLKMVIEDASTAYMNALRRIMMSDIPTPSIYQIDLQHNTTDFVPEILAHQLSMLTIRMPDTIDTVGFALDITNTGSTIRKLYARDLVPDDQRVTLVNPDTLLGYISEGQRICLFATTKWGTAREHARWTHCHCTFAPVPEVAVSQDRQLDAVGREQMSAICPRGVFDIEDGWVRAPRSEQCTFCDECAAINQRLGVAVEVRTKQQSFTFEIESYGTFTVSDIITRATKLLNSRLDSVRTRVLRELPKLPRTPPISPTTVEVNSVL
jgi:DNA-directed RNA polymerase alpha subunit